MRNGGLGYSLEVGIRESYIYAGVLPVTSKTDGPARILPLVPRLPANVRRRVLIESYIDEPLTVWKALPVVVALMNVGCECLEIAVIDPKAVAETQRELELHLSNEEALKIRLFEKAEDAEKWFEQSEDKGVGGGVTTGFRR